MAVEITATPEEPTAALSAVRLDVTGGSSNDDTTYDTENYPTEDPIVYRIVASKTGVDNLVSEEFTVSYEGKWTWNNVYFPESGSWTVDLVRQSDESVDATLALTVA